MPMAFKVGQIVKQKVPVIQGPISGVAIVDNEVAFEVTWTDADGEQHARYFREEELAVVAEPANTDPTV